MPVFLPSALISSPLGSKTSPIFPWWLAAPLAFPLGGRCRLSARPALACGCAGDYLAIVTLGFAEAFRETIRNLDFAGGDQGIIVKSYALFRGFLGLNGGSACYVFTALILFLAVFLVQRLYHSPVGRACDGHPGEKRSRGGVRRRAGVQMKLLAFSLSAAIAAVAGVLSRRQGRIRQPRHVRISAIDQVLAMVILGGLATATARWLGAALLYLVPEYLKRLSMLQDNRDIHRDRAFLSGAIRSSIWPITGCSSSAAVMVLMMLYRPQGLARQPPQKKRRCFTNDPAARNPRTEQDLRRPESRAERRSARSARIASSSVIGPQRRGQNDFFQLPQGIYRPDGRSHLSRRQ